MVNYKVESINQFKGLELTQNKKNSRTVYFIKQRLCGVVMFVIGIICPIIFDGDATFSLFAVPIGIGLLVTNKQVMTFLAR